MFFRISVDIWLSERTLSLMNVLKYHWCETMQVIISTCFEACDAQRFHFQEVCARDRFSILPRMKKSMALCSILKKFSCHVTLLLKRIL